MKSVVPLPPRPPRQISDYAKAVLLALADSNLGGMLSLGGAFGLSYYYEYRPTHDIDTWWKEDISQEDRQSVVKCLETALKPFGEVHTRRWGEVYSIELIPLGGTRVVFSFQIAARSAILETPLPAPWPKGMKVDALPDLLASKMVALIERGAPRDFRDVYTLCQAGITTPQQCWNLWRMRQQLAQSDNDNNRARLAIQTHLARLDTHRPLDQIRVPKERKNAEHLRSWFSEEFINALLD